MAVIFGVISALPLWLVFFFTKEKEDFTAQDRPRLIESLKAAFKNRPFVFMEPPYWLGWPGTSIDCSLPRQVTPNASGSDHEVTS